MSTHVQYRRGTATQNNAFVGALAEITVDTTNLTLRVHDGINAGGSNIATVAYVNNAIGSLSANSITDGTSNVRIAGTNGNVAVSVAGISNVAVFSSNLLSVAGNILPAANVTYDLGSASQRWRDLYLDGNSIFLGNARISANATAIILTNPNGGETVLSGITPEISASTVTATGNVTGGNLNTAGQVVALGNVVGNFFIGNGSQLTGIDATSIQNGSANVRTFENANVTISAAGVANILVVTGTGANVEGTLNATGNANVGNLGTTTVVATTLTGTLSTAAQTNITSVGTLGSLTVTGNITGGNLVTAGLVSLSSITKTGSNGVGNIGAATSTFNTIFARATSALYADLAELYTTDQEYTPGTVLVFGGTAEVTESTQSHSARIAGVVSTEPAHVMNSGLMAEHTVTVALVGRVPCRVVGTINRGDCLVSSDIPGVATALDAVQYQPGVVIGKALANYNSTEPGVIEAVVGRL